MRFLNRLAVPFALVLGVTVWRNYSQANKTTKLLRQQERFSRANIVLNLTQTFFQNGRPKKSRLSDPEWMDRYWDLHSTEFYLYHQRIVPGFLYALWMVDLGDFYRSDPDVWLSHEKFLAFYTVLYPEMEAFFGEINRLVKRDEDLEVWHQNVKAFVLTWIEAHSGTDLD